MWPFSAAFSAVLLVPSCAACSGTVLDSGESTFDGGVGGVIDVIGAGGVGAVDSVSGACDGRRDTEAMRNTKATLLIVHVQHVASAASSRVDQPQPQP